jgi:hypothetical protein
MGGLVSGITDAVSDVVGGVGDVAGNALKGVASNPIGAAYSLATGNLKPLIGSALSGVSGGGGANTGTPGYFTGGGGSPIIINAAQPQQQGMNYGGLFASLLPSLIQGTGGVLQGQTSREAAQKAADLARQSGSSAAQMAQFRPVGTTTRFGTSTYSIDPATGGLKADYSLSPLAAGYQQSLADMTGQGLMQGQQVQNLAGQYLGESPEAVRQRYVQQQTALVAPQQEQALAGIRNRLFQTGRGGLATGATEAGGLAATNPEMAAYYNSLANQQRQIAAGADQAAQQQIQFGQQLAGQAYNPFLAGFGAQSSVESAAQQPLTLANELAKLQAASGAQAGTLGLRGDLSAANAYLTPEYQLNPLAKALGSLGQSQALGTALGGIFGGTGTGSSGSTGLGGLFGDLFSGNPTGLGTGGIDYDYLSQIYSGGNPFEGILGAGETWMGE